jgi:hypothetical protein
VFLRFEAAVDRMRFPTAAKLFEEALNLVPEEPILARCA